jgi:hypothetical protein
MTDEKNQSMDAADTPESTSFVPSSLASFVARAQATLDDVQLSLQSPAKSSTRSTSVSMDQDASFASMREDEDDKQLKQQVLDNLDKKKRQEHQNDFILDTANLLFALDEQVEEMASQEQPSPIKAGGEEESHVLDFLSDDTPEKIGLNVYKDQSQQANAGSNKDTESKRESGGSRASGWRNLIASVPGKAQNVLDTSLTKSPAKSQASQSAGNDPLMASPAKSVPENGTDDATTGSELRPKDTIMSPSIPDSIDPMAMSCALEVTSPLQVHENPKLSASTPELASPSPWKNAFQSMVARLEDRVTPPTPEQSSPSPSKDSPPKDLTSSPAVNESNVKPSPVVPNSSSGVSHQRVKEENVEDSVSSATSALPEASSQSMKKSGLILSPSDSLPSAQTAKEMVASTPKSSPPVTRQSGLVLSPSDSLPAHSPLVARKSGLVLSPPDSLPGLSSKPVVTSEMEVSREEKTLSRQATRPSGLVLSPSDSLPEPSPKPVLTNEMEELQEEESVSPQATRQSRLVLSPSDSVPIPSPQPAETCAVEALRVEESISPQAMQQSGLVLSPSDSLPGPSPKPTVTNEVETPREDETVSPRATRQSGLVLSPSDSLPPPSPQPTETCEVETPREGETVPSPVAVEKSGNVSLSQSLSLQSNALSPDSSLPISTPKSAAQPPTASRTSFPDSSSKSTNQFKNVSSQAADSASKSHLSADKSASGATPAILSLKASPRSTEKDSEVSSPALSVSKFSREPVAKNIPFSSPAIPATKASHRSTEKGEKTSLSKSPSQVPANSVKARQSSTGKETSGVVSLPVASVSNPSSKANGVAPKTALSPKPRHPVVEPVAPINEHEMPAADSAEKTNPRPASSDFEKEHISTVPPIAPTPPVPSSDAFFPNIQTFAAETPPSSRQMRASKSEAPKRLTQARNSVNARKSLPVAKSSVETKRRSSNITGSAVPMMKSTPSSDSRLLQGMASSQAHAKGTTSEATKPQQTRSRLSRGTAATNARAKIVSPQANNANSAVRKSTSVDDGRAKAVERVRQQKLAAEKKRKEAEATQKTASRSSTRATKLSAEEGRARARERVKRQQATGTAPPVNGKENRVRPSNQGGASTSPGSSASRHRPTIPKSPNFATTAMRGSKPRVERVRESSMRLDPNPISRALGSPTHSDRDKASRSGTFRSTSSSTRKLTIPKAPKLSTSAKYGDKPPPSLQAKKPVPPVAQPKPPRKREFKPTQPVPFKFHSSKTCASAPATSKETEPSLAESVQLYSQRGLRDETPASTSVKRISKPTIPKSPEFHAISKRAMPKSTAEMEEEMMGYYKAHPFKAAPIGGVPETGPSKPIPKRRLTQPAPFHFRSEDRATHSKPPIGSPDPEAKDLEECKKQFHARPLPRMSLNRPPPRKEPAPRTITTPRPFSFSTEKRAAAQSEPHGPSADEVEMSKQFHARPLPQSTYTDPKKQTRSAPSKAVATPRHYAGPPKLATSARTEPREAARLASLRNAEEMAKQRERLALQRKREKHQEDMAKACLTSPPANIEPFHLQSEARHKAYQQHLAEQLEAEEEERKRTMLFTAKPLRLSDPPKPIRSNRPATTPRPFALQSVSRHELWREERRQQLEAEERERQRLMNVKAIPLPDTTYKYTPLTPAPKKNQHQEKELDCARKKALAALENAENSVEISLSNDDSSPGAKGSLLNLSWGASG